MQQDLDEVQGIKLQWVATQDDLNDAESANVFSAMRWSAREIRRKHVTVPSDDCLRQLHTRMIGEVWK